MMTDVVPAGKTPLQLRQEERHTTEQHPFVPTVADCPQCQANPVELTDSEKLDAVYRFCAQFGDLVVQAAPMIEKLSSHPMLQAFLS